MSLTYADAYEKSKSLPRKAFAIAGVVVVHVAVFYALSAARPSITLLKPLKDSVAVFIPLERPKPEPPKPPKAEPVKHIEDVVPMPPQPVEVPDDIPLIQQPPADDAMGATTEPEPISVPQNAFSITRKVDPAYPSAARRAGEQGTVLLNIVIGADGKPVEVSVAKSSGHPSLDDAAVNAVRQWRFATTVQGLARVTLPITFRLQAER